jgi:hypothetical protein
VNEPEKADAQPTGEQRPPENRPPAPVPTEAALVRFHASLGLDDSDIAACLEISRTEVRKKYRNLLKRCRAQRRAMIRKYQLEQASKSPAVINMMVRDEFGEQSAANKRDGARDAEPRLDEKVG